MKNTKWLCGSCLFVTQILNTVAKVDIAVIVFLCMWLEISGKIVLILIMPPFTSYTLAHSPSSFAPHFLPPRLKPHVLK